MVRTIGTHEPDTSPINGPDNPQPQPSRTVSSAFSSALFSEFAASLLSSSAVHGNNRAVDEKVREILNGTGPFSLAAATAALRTGLRQGGQWCADISSGPSTSTASLPTLPSYSLASPLLFSSAPAPALTLVPPPPASTSPCVPNCDSQRQGQDHCDSLRTVEVNV